MGNCYSNAYKLDDNGFSETLNARYTESYEHIGNEKYNIHREYFIDGDPASEADYNNAINAAFAFSKSVKLNQNAVSYDEITKRLII